MKMLLRKLSGRENTFIILTGGKKNQCLSGPTQLKPMLFKSQLYVIVCQYIDSPCNCCFKSL